MKFIKKKAEWRSINYNHGIRSFDWRCPTCGKDVKESHDRCPHCNQKLKFEEPSFVDEVFKKTSDFKKAKKI